jgi:hypothetical protein
MTMIDLVIVIAGLIILALYIAYIGIDDDHKVDDEDSYKKKRK